MGRKTYLKIVMPSAPTVSFAPYDSQTIGLTTWDEAAIIDGVTYHPARFALGDGTSTGDFSKGKGGLALGNQIASLELENIFSGGFLKNYVDAGIIPLVGAVVTILDGVGATPQTWVLQEPSGDGPVLSFKLCTPGYLNQKRLQFAAMRYDGAATVGLAVGDAAVQGGNAAGRYKGVSVPTKAFADWEPLQYPGIAVSGKRGNPQSWGAEEYGSTTHPYDYVGTAPSGYFSFVFPSQALRDAFYLQYNGDSYSLSGAYIAPNSCLLVSDGSNSEIIVQSDATGYVAFAGTAYLTKDTRTINSVVYYVLDLSVKTDGMLASSAVSSIQLYFLQQDNPICAGASSVVGFQSKASNASEYGITSPTSVQTLKNNILYLMPTQQAIDGFMSWTELDNPRGFAWNPKGYSLISAGGQGSVTYAFGGNIENISTSSKSVPSIPFESSLSTVMTVYAKLGFIVPLVHFLMDKDFDFEITKIFVDRKYSIEGSGPATPSGGMSSIAWYWQGPFDTVEQNVDDSAITSVNKTFDLIGPGRLIKSSTFDSLESLLSLSHYVYAFTIGVPSPPMTAIEKIYQIVLYAITKLAFGSNPAVVVPGNFPGTSNPTTTPTLAAAQLAAWLGLSNISLTGGITPTAGTWGEYLGEDPSSTSSDDTTSAKDRLSSLLQEACIYGAETGGTVALPDVEVAEHPSTPSSSIDDVVTMPQFTYCYAGTSAQFTAKILNVDEAFDISKGDGYYWGGWQEKDTCHLSQPATTTNVISILAVGDLLFANTSDAKLMRSLDGGDTWQFACASTLGLLVDAAGSIYVFERTAGYSYSPDGYSWTSHTWGDGRTIYGAWYDATTGRLWCCGKDANNIGSMWYTTDGSNWTLIWPTVGGNGIAGAIEDVRAVGDQLLMSYHHAANGWTIATSTDLGESGTAYAWQPLSMPFLSYWDGKFRVAWGTQLYSSSDLSAFTNSNLPIAATGFATDGKGVVWGIASADEYYRTIYSRDNGSTWKIIPFGVDSGMANQAIIWDVNAMTFRVANYRPQVMSLGDPSVLDIWLRCREASLATSTLATDTFDKRGLYDASELVRWLLDCKDGTDAEYQQPFIKWITRPARFVIVRGKYQSIVDQLSVAAGLPITIPRKMLTYSGYDQNLPTRGIISKATHTLSGTDAGLSEIEIIMPPL